MVTSWCVMPLCCLAMVQCTNKCTLTLADWLQAATSAPLIERSIERATGIVYNITGGRDLTLQEVNRVSEVSCVLQ